MWYTGTMLKNIILLSSLAPSIACAHDWDNDYWLERFLRNHNKVAECMLYLEDNAREDFTENCSVHVMGATENDIQKEFYQQLEEHPDLDEVDFLIEHFPAPPSMDADEYAHIIGEIYQQVLFFEGIDNLIISMYIADAIIKTDKRMEDK